MSKLDCVATSHVLSTELTASLGKPASSNPGSLLEEISDNEEDVIIVGGNPTNNVNPRSISAQLVTDGPKIPLLNPSLKLKRLERPAVPVSKKCRGGRTSKRFKCVPRTLSEIDFCEKLSEVEWVKTDPCPNKVVPESLKIKFDLSKMGGMGNVVSITPATKCSDPIVGGVPSVPSIDTDPSGGHLDFEVNDQVGLGDEMNCGDPSDCVLYSHLKV
ncbi:MAG: hypothetical protein GY928_39210 [Colwellia sp.]|nr:hypothetical protein [Colwellia sp.]